MIGFAIGAAAALGFLLGFFIAEALDRAQVAAYRRELANCHGRLIP